MIKQTNNRLFYNDFASLMEKHFNKMDRCCYLNANGEVTSVTLEQQTPLFANFFWSEMRTEDPDRYQKLGAYLDQDQDLESYNLNYRDQLKEEAETFIIEKIAEPIYI